MTSVSLQIIKKGRLFYRRKRKLDPNFLAYTKLTSDGLRTCIHKAKVLKGKRNKHPSYP